MKISLIISVLIIIVAAVIGLPRLLRLQAIKSDYHKLEDYAQDLGISTNSSPLAHSDRSPATNQEPTSPEKVNLFTTRIIDHLTRNGSAKEQNEIIAELITLSPSDWTHLVQKLAQNQSIEKNPKVNFLNTAFMTIFRDYPAAGLSLTMEMGHSFQQSGKSHDSMIQVAVSCLTEKDPESAAQWIMAHPAKAAKFESIGKLIIRSAATKDPHLALRLIATFNLSDDPQAYFDIGSGIDNESAHNFMTFLRSSTLSADQKNQALTGIASSQLIQDFGAATSWFLSSDLTTEEQLTATQDLSYHSVKKDTPQWMDWITKRSLAPEEVMRRQTRLMQDWARQDYSAAGHWLNEQPEGAPKHSVIKTYAEALSYHEPEAAADWAITLPQNEERDHLLRTILTAFKEKTPEAASSFIQKHGLTPPN